MDQTFFTTTQAAQFIGLKPGTLEIWRVQGKGPQFLKFGRAVRYRKTDVDAWIDAQVRCSTSEQPKQ